ncbi:SGNH/GDSL hydrolase family protein [Paenibacillus allorhizosphaerae]|uniref:SGNH hydrolase-type esterase domain-containing protein n=1 Tax=Paenibacillus allorhizosphaerae TaxID=2849866 RepID=A0ABN7TWR6_9BACL|nr:SGNH/GDSL hydrolase family protein [Paenibacillus allorhizosphaerae]CAG7658748.1 hypothetical protein PAECIP111802_07153 [Paenibacillus allorhizosphaerae]
MIYRNVELHNVQQIEETADGVRLCRVPEHVRMSLNESAKMNRAYNTCGCELRFNLIGEEARIVLRKEPGKTVTKHGLAEVYFGPFQAAYPTTPAAVSSDGTEIVIRYPGNLEELKQLAKLQQLPFDPALVRVILPYEWIYKLVGIEGEVAPPGPEQTPELRYLSYGSSITHGGDAARPTGTYAMRTAQRLGADLINMGFAGSAHMDEAVAEYIASRDDWSFATLEMGINVFRFWEPELFERKVNRFLSVIAGSEPNRPIVCTDLFYCIYDIQENPKIGVFRDIVRTAVQKLERPNVHYIPGTELLTSAQELSADLIHPSAAGHELIAERLSVRIVNVLEPQYFPKIKRTV